MKLLLFGKRGQVGWELQRALAPLGEVVAPDRDATRPGGDLSRLSELAGTVEAVRPDAIVNAAAYTAVDCAESAPDAARLVNATALALLAREAARSGAWLVHYSSDHVYDGSGVRPWTEGDATAPLNVYGRTKLEGDEAIRASGCRHLILRTSWIHAPRRANFARTILSLAAAQERIEVVDDQIGAPTSAELVADVTAYALRAALEQPALGGTYHVAAAGETSRHGWARCLVEAARSRGAPLRAAPEAIVAVPSDACAARARRPLNSRLDCRKLERAFRLAMPPWQHGVERMIAELLDR